MLHIVHRQHTERTFIDEIYLEKMNRVRVLVLNPTFLEELGLDGDEVDPADLAPCTSGNTPTVTSPAVKDEEVAGEHAVDGVGEAIWNLEELVQETDDEEDAKVNDILEKLERCNVETEEILKKMRDIISFLPEGTSSRQHTVVPNVDVWDTGKAIEQEYRLYPNPTMKEIRDRLSNQVWDLLQILQERVNQHTYNDKDIELISGLKSISVLNSRLSVITDTVLKRKAEKP